MFANIEEHKQKEWYLALKQLSGASALSMSANTTYCAVGFSNKTIAVYSLEDKKEILRETFEFDTYITSIRFDPFDENKFISTGPDCIFYIWDIQKRGYHEGFENNFQEWVTGMDFLDNPRKLVTSALTLKVWDYKRKVPIQMNVSTHKDWIRSFIVLRGTNYVLTGSSDRTIKIWNLKNKRLIYTIMKAHNEFVSGLVQAPGTRLFYSSSCDGTIKLWHLRNPKKPAYIFMDVNEYGILSLAITKDGKFLISGSEEGILTIRNTENKQSIYKHQSDLGSIWKLIFSKDDKYLIGGFSKKTINIWNFKEELLDKAEQQDQDKESEGKLFLE